MKKSGLSLCMFVACLIISTVTLADAPVETPAANVRLSPDESKPAEPGGSDHDNVQSAQPPKIDSSSLILEKHVPGYGIIPYSFGKCLYDCESTYNRCLPPGGYMQGSEHSEQCQSYYLQCKYECSVSFPECDISDPGPCGGRGVANTSGGGRNN